MVFAVSRRPHLILMCIYSLYSLYGIRSFLEFISLNLVPHNRALIHVLYDDRSTAPVCGDVNICIKRYPYEFITQLKACAYVCVCMSSLKTARRIDSPLFPYCLSSSFRHAGRKNWRHQQRYVAWEIVTRVEKPVVRRRMRSIADQLEGVVIRTEGGTALQIFPDRSTMVIWGKLNARIPLVSDG